jgi:hypothetical protein
MTIEEKQELKTLRDSLRAAEGEIRRLKKQWPLVLDWMDAASKSGFVFAVRRDGFEVEHNPPLAKELLAIRLEEAECERDAALAKLAEASEIGRQYPAKLDPNGWSRFRKYESSLYSLRYSLARSIVLVLIRK